MCDYDEIPAVSNCLVTTGTLSTTLDSVSNVVISNENDQTRVELTTNIKFRKQLFDQLSFFKYVFHHIFTLQLPTNENKLINIKQFNVEKLTYNAPMDGGGWQIIITFISIK
jgi:hypothetical protein